MSKRRSDIKGFTLAELLIAVAIIGILAAISVPSIFNAQKNMHMLELDNAANSIAVAAQKQMTSMKVSGTWLGMLEEDEDYKKQVARGLPEEVAETGEEEERDLRYFTAKQARENGILPSLSIDESVYKGDFIIEYSKSTATVCGVFYSDGKSGMFDSETVDSAAKAYYLSNGFTASSRDSEARSKASPLIGYYWGTPAGATKNVALANPSIWVDEQGLLCIENPNLAGTEGWKKNTSLEVSISGMSGEGIVDDTRSFRIEGLQGTAINTGKISVMEEEETESYTFSLNSSPENADIITIDSTVFSIDLNALVDYLSRQSDVPEKIMGLLQGFSYGETLIVEAGIKAVERPYIPATAEAQIQWPKKSAKITVLVNDPKISNMAQGIYSDLKVDAATNEGSAPSNFKILDADEKFIISGTPDSLNEETNQSAGTQHYIGGEAGLEDAASKQGAFKVFAGSYQGSALHHYEITELWVLSPSNVRTIIGYLQYRDDEAPLWIWTDLGQQLANTGAIELNLDSSNVQTALVRAQHVPALIAAYPQLCDEDGNFTLYVRTAPKAAEVGTYLKGNINGLTSNRAVQSARMAEKNSSSRKKVENEFGAPSSTAYWSIVNSTTSGIEGFPANASTWRIYYSATPALGFNSDLSALNNALNNAVLWCAEDSSIMALVREPRENDGYSHLTMQDNLGDGSDFGIPYDKDYLFYRALFYRNEDGNIINSLSPQVVPYSTQGVPAVAAIAEGPAKDGFIFRGWDTASIYPAAQDVTIRLAQGAVVGDYHSREGQYNLAYGRIDLYARSDEESVGFVYGETYSDGTHGFYGYFDSKPDGVDINTLNNEMEILDWGYYALVIEQDGYARTPSWNAQGSKGDFNKTDLRITANDTGIIYACFTTPVFEKQNKAETKRNVAFTLSGISEVKGTYSFNYNFAKAVETDIARADLWGKHESTPFVVRDASQFPGALSDDIGDIARGNYLGLCYLQERNIDMNNASLDYVSSFSGTYDAGIYGEDGALLGRNQIQNYTLDAHGKEWYILGLFYTTSGATLKNIDMVELQNPYFSSPRLAGDNGMTAGFFAGKSTNTTFKKCSVIGIRQKTSEVINAPIDIEVDIIVGSWLRSYIGSIVGYAKESTFIDCTASNIQINFNKEYRGSVRHVYGGLIGHVSTGSPTIIANTTDVPLVHDVGLFLNREFDVGVWPIEAYKKGTGGLVGSAMNKNSISFQSPFDPNSDSNSFKMVQTSTVSGGKTTTTALSNWYGRTIDNESI